MHEIRYASDVKIWIHMYGMLKVQKANKGLGRGSERACYLLIKQIF